MAWGPIPIGGGVVMPAGLDNSHAVPGAGGGVVEVAPAVLLERARQSA